MVLMALRGTGHGLSTEDMVTAIALTYLRKKYAVKDELELEGRQFNGICYSVFGHYKDDEGKLKQFMVKVDRNGNVLEH
jgi:hypothetical protein